jgi:hypothetical protein
MLTVECRTPIDQLWDKQACTELTAQVARDLRAILGIEGQTALVFCGAAFSSEQLLQPGFPVQQQLSQYASAAFQGQQQANQVLSVGANDGHMPKGLQPMPAEHQLYHLPFCLFTDDDRLTELFEQQLMHKGMVSPPTYELLSQQTRVVINHANYMTSLDLVAMMHNHYQQLGLSHLWEVIETALVNPDPKSAVTTQTGNHFYLLDQLLFTPFFTWREWQSMGPENDPQSYIDWLMAQRLSVGAFISHGLDVRAFRATQWPLESDKICLGSFEQQRIQGSWFSEELTTDHDHPAGLSHHLHPQAGLVAISQLSGDHNVRVYYPVLPHGIRAINAHLSNQMAQQPAVTEVEWAHSTASLA